MTSVCGCEFPDHLFYQPEGDSWSRLERDGTVTIGLTSYAAWRLGTILSCVPKKVGKEVRQDQSCATLETNSWAGPVKSPVAGEVVAVNQDVVQNPELINSDTYGRGWIVRIQPRDWTRDSSGLATGAEAMERLRARLEAESEGCR